MAFLALDEDFTVHYLMFVYIWSAAFVIVATQKLVPQQSNNVTAKPYRPLLLLNSPWRR